MAWLRLDDGFTEHRKLIGLKRSERWTWLELLTYCARQQNGGTVPEGITDILRWVTPAFLNRCIALGLIDRDDEKSPMRVHDWDLYNAETVGDKVAAYLAKHPDATANEVHRAIGGKRELVLAAVSEIRSPNGTPPVPAAEPEANSTGSPGTTTGTTLPVPESVPSRARASPSRPQDQDPPTETETVVYPRTADGLGSGSAGLEPIGETIKTEATRLNPDPDSDIDF